MLGSFYGLIMSQKLSPGMICGHLLDDSWLKMYARFTMGMSLIASWIFTKDLITAFSSEINNSYIMLILRGIIPGLLLGMSLFFFADYIYVILGLLTI